MGYSKGANPRVSVVLPCRNEASSIKPCILSVLAQEAPPAGFELIVADGMSDDGTREILSQLTAELGERGTKHGGREPIIRVIDNPRQIVSAGLNAAIRAARGDIIIRMDAHTEYAPDYIARCVETLEQTGADNVGGPARTKADTRLQKAIAAAYHSPFSVGGARFHDPDYEGYVDTVTYGCWRRETFDKFGYFDEELVRNQDDEHNLRIIRGGGKIYQSPRIKSWYKPRSSLTALFKQYLQYGYWKVRVIQKHKLPASWRHLVPGAFVFTLMLLFLLSAFCFLLSGFRFHPSSPVSFCFLRSAFCFVFTLFSYLIAVLAASLITAAKTDWKLLPLLPFVFPCYHFGYGVGFLRGVLDFIILRRGGNRAFTALTR
jgi:succinoglycan biosynthesis protein ExoA